MNTLSKIKLLKNIIQRLIHKYNFETFIHHISYPVQEDMKDEYGSRGTSQYENTTSF